MSVNLAIVCICSSNIGTYVNVFTHITSAYAPRVLKIALVSEDHMTAPGPDFVTDVVEYLKTIEVGPDRGSYARLYRAAADAVQNAGTTIDRVTTAAELTNISRRRHRVFRLTKCWSTQLGSPSHLPAASQL